MYLIFDTETTGFYKQIKPDPSDPANYPHVIQLGFILMDEKFEVVQTYCELIQPDGWKVPTDKFWIDNGYTTEKSQKYGIPIAEVLNAFCKAVDISHTLIAHNMKFDHPIISAEMKRHNIMPTKKPDHKICTMQESTQFCKLPRKNGSGIKFPTLMELHMVLFKKGFENAHDALEDVRATMKCFIALRKKKII
tara:strand:+ start:1256 stop:1834 length:579 start_codon:yes stop_codon:yes gene_type:complete